MGKIDLFKKTDKANLEEFNKRINAINDALDENTPKGYRGYIDYSQQIHMTDYEEEAVYPYHEMVRILLDVDDCKKVTVIGRGHNDASYQSTSGFRENFEKIVGAETTADTWADPKDHPYTTRWQIEVSKSENQDDEYDNYFLMYQGRYKDNQKLPSYTTSGEWREYKGILTYDSSVKEDFEEYNVVDRIVCSEFQRYSTTAVKDYMCFGGLNFINDTGQVGRFLVGVPYFEKIGDYNFLTFDLFGTVQFSGDMAIRVYEF